MKKIVVGILYGGQSVEHDISVISATNVVANINRDEFEIRLIAIDKKGSWFLCSSVSDKIEQAAPLTFALHGTTPLFSTDLEEFTLDVVFPVLHGTDGEDGSVQGLLQTFNIPFVGSGVLGSAMSMDKVTAKRLLQHDGIPVASFLAYKKSELENINFKTISERLGVPFILKPSNLGSSVGVAKITSENGFLDNVKGTFQYDDVILFEEFIDGREMECAILGNEKLIASVPGEINLNGSYDFYSFEAKYVDSDAAVLTIPAKVPREVSDLIKRLSSRAYKLLNCHDLARVDLFVKQDGSVYVNEINTIPGFTNISMYPRLMAHEGLSYSKLISTLLEMAIERHTLHSELSTDFESNL